MGQVKFLTELSAMEGFVVLRVKLRGDFIEGWGRMLTLAQDGTAVDITQEDIKVMRLIGKSLIVVKHISTLLPAHAGCNPDGFG
jgi:hypothetical protein